MTAQKFPSGWNEARVRRVLEYYESQSDDEAAADIEAGSESTLMEVPVALVPEVRVLIEKRRGIGGRSKKSRINKFRPTSRAGRKSKPIRNSSAALG